ncbi:hypothetical protein NSA19_03620 [Actinomyces bowdenii]|uniref:hypothetical protein n=1 Tax=Actinomyces bowdenii TaxID=131109 RepID=UPI00214C4D66|nr:hypothetical protein [Actinomyces bowdenii]MCR2051957.1 hypothetical protein [Actinomyces bowdenii]
MAHLLGDGSAARTEGMMTWTSSKPKDVRNHVEVVTGTIEVEGAYLQMQYNTPRPWAVRLIYLGSAVPIRRVCVHGNGHGLGRCTHMHTYQPADGSERCVPAEGFPECRISSSVSNDERCKMFLAFADLCHVDASGLTWVDPPKEEMR